MRIWGEALLTQVIVQTKIIPDASGLHQLSLKIPIFVLLIFSLPSVHNRKILLNFTKNLIPDRGPSVEYSVRYFNFVFYLLFIYGHANFPEKDNKGAS